MPNATARQTTNRIVQRLESIVASVTRAVDGKDWGLFDSEDEKYLLSIREELKKRIAKNRSMI